MNRIILYLALVLSCFQMNAQQVKVYKSSSGKKHVVVNTSATPYSKNETRTPFIYFTQPSTAIKPYRENILQSKVKIYNFKGITYTKDGSGITECYLNGSLVRLNENNQFDETVILKPGLNSFIFISRSNSGAFASDTLLVNYTKPESKNYILQIAINEYDNWPNLENPVNNAVQLNEVLENKYGFRNGEIINLFNKDASMDNIYDKFQYLIKNIKPNDKLVIFFSGHGHYDENLSEGYWIPHEARRNKPSDYITNSEIVNFIKAINSKHTLLIADACFAGSMMELAMRGENELNYENYEKRKSRWVFTSGRIEKVEDKSVFTEQIIKVLHKNNKPNLLFTELSLQVTEAVSANSDQMPVSAPIKYANHEGGQFVFHMEE